MPFISQGRLSELIFAKVIASSLVCIRSCEQESKYHDIQSEWQLQHVFRHQVQACKVLLAALAALWMLELLYLGALRAGNMFAAGVGA